MSDATPPSGFALVEVPARVADLGFTFLKPNDWVVADLPDEPLELSDPLNFKPLAVCHATFAPIVFSASARPGYADGTVAQWLEFLAREGGCDPGPVEREAIERHDAVGCWAGQVSDGTLMRMRLALLEDGGRLVQVSVMAPEAVWSSVSETLRTMLASFALVAPQGTTVALSGTGELPPSTFLRVVAPQAVAPRPEEPERDAAPPASAAIEEAPEDPPPTPTPSTYAGVALAADAATLDPEHPLNARLRDSGAGLTPKVLAVDEAERWALIGAGAIVATLRVPFGWHVLDDGKRTLVFDAGGQIQVNFSRRPREGDDDNGVLERILAGLREEWPQLEHLRLELADMPCLAIRNIVAGGAPVEQAYLLRDAAPGSVLVVRVTATPDRIGGALDLAEVLLRDLRMLDDGNQDPWWWLLAVELEQHDRIEDAEALIRQQIDHYGCGIQLAHLHYLRLCRMRAAGDDERALAAFERSAHWMRVTASGATSGGEGAALQLQEREHRQQLVAALGYDPQRA